jgi:ribosomal protein L29
MKYKDFKTKTTALTKSELAGKAVELRGEIAKMKLAIKSGKAKNLRGAFLLRKQLAVVNSFFNKS